MTAREVLGLKEFLKTYPSPCRAACRNAPWDDEPETEWERRAVEEGLASVAENGGRRIPDEEMWRELDLESA